MDPSKLTNNITNGPSLPSANGLTNNVNPSLNNAPKTNTPEIDENNNALYTESINENNQFNPNDARESSNNESIPNGFNESQESEPKPGDKVGDGKQIDEDGNVEDSSTKKTLKAVGRGAAAYFTGGQSIGRDKDVANFKPVDKTLGVVSDSLDKVPGVEEVSKELDEAGLADGVNDVLDTVGNAKNGDIGGTIESGKNALKDVEKTKSYAKKKAMKVIIPVAALLFFLSAIFMGIFAPVLGGFLDVVESDSDEVAELEEDGVNEFFFDNEDQEVTGQIIGEISGFENLSGARQKIIAAAASAVAAKVKYSYGSHPHAAGLMGIPTSGLDCAGFVQWALWTGLGGNPGYLTTASISNKIGTDFIQISESELQPGDIGLKRTGGSDGDNYNHTGIYAGNGQWFHAAGSKTGVVRGNYSGFTIFLRYKGVE
ncbi:MAG: C40 family peptidase [Erysipelotrichales bacterium]|nr:C40 family peptidase [Erysipelotrichales bacterium]